MLLMISKHNVLIDSWSILIQVQRNLKLNPEVFTNRIYGVTMNPETHEYGIVTEFQNGGNLKRMLSEYHNGLSWEKIIQLLEFLSSGLMRIHQENYYHKDIHSGNILSAITEDTVFSDSNDFFDDDLTTITQYTFFPVISDFGFCRPV